MRGKGAGAAAAMAALLAAGATAAERPAAPLEASSPWNVDYAPTNCTLARRFADGKAGEKDDSVLMFRRTPLSDRVQLLLGIGSWNGAFRMGKGLVRIGTGDATPFKYEAYPSQQSGRYILRGALPLTLFADLPKTVELAIEAEPKQPSRTLTLVGATAAFAALAKCDADLARTWGIDPEERRKIAVAAEPVGDPGRWFTSNDYPKEALDRGAQGSTVILYAIGLDGRIADCRVVVTSGVADLDRLICPALTRRARYKPAIDAEARPMVSHDSKTVKWILGNTWRGDWD